MPELLVLPSVKHALALECQACCTAQHQAQHQAQHAVDGLRSLNQICSKIQKCLLLGQYIHCMIQIYKHTFMPCLASAASSMCVGSSPTELEFVKPLFHLISVPWFTLCCFMGKLKQKPTTGSCPACGLQCSGQLSHIAINMTFHDALWIHC